MLSTIAFWFVNRSRTNRQVKPVVLRVDNRRTDYCEQPSKEQSLRSAGFLSLGALAIGIFVAVIISVLAAFTFSTLTNSLGN